MALLAAAAAGAVAVGAVGLAAEEARHAERRRAERLLYAVAAQPGGLERLQALTSLEEAALVPLMVVCFDRVELSPALLGSKVQLVVKLGDPGQSLKHSSPRVRADAQGAAQLRGVAVLPWRPDMLTPLVRVRMLRAGWLDRHLGKDEFWLTPSFGGEGPLAGEQDCVFFNLERDPARRQPIAQVHVSAMVQYVSLAELRRGRTAGTRLSLPRRALQAQGLGAREGLLGHPPYQHDQRERFAHAEGIWHPADWPPSPRGPAAPSVVTGRPVGDSPRFAQVVQGQVLEGGEAGGKAV